MFFSFTCCIWSHSAELYIETMVWLQNQRKHDATYGISSSTSRSRLRTILWHRGGHTFCFDVLPVPERCRTPTSHTIPRKMPPTKQTKISSERVFLDKSQKIWFETTKKSHFSVSDATHMRVVIWENAWGGVNEVFLAPFCAQWSRSAKNRVCYRWEVAIGVEKNKKVILRQNLAQF